MKRLYYLPLACATLCCACTSQLKEDDYTGAFSRYAAENTGDDVKGAEQITVVPIRDITAGDSIDYITYSLSQEYLTQLTEKKAAWEKKQSDCEKDEKANILRHEEHMKKYEQMKRQYGNDIKYQSKIDSYKKAAERLPATHEEYVEFDRRRSYSFTRDCEELKADYENFQALGVEGFAAADASMQRYAGIDRTKILATVAEVSYAQAGKADTKTTYLFGHEPMRVIGKFDNETPNIFDYQLNLPENPEE